MHTTGLNAILSDKLSRPAIYKQANLFPKEISPIRLATFAPLAIDKFENDYSICSFKNLIERRAARTSVELNLHQAPQCCTYRTIIGENNAFRPSLRYSMDRNSSHLAEHLFKILRLNPIDQPEDEQSPQRYFDTSIYLTDQEIFDHATLHDLPICLSIDGSLGEDEVATTTVSIVAPDIRETDAIDGGEWQDRIAKVLLIRSCRLPMKWGTSNTSINMAESIGFLLGEYMIPSDYPIIYVTDSNNARSLQCNLTNMHNYTHRYNVRHVKQGIDYAIANHFEYLTKRWPRKYQLSPYAM